jgi:hypothetical protein
MFITEDKIVKGVYFDIPSHVKNVDSQNEPPVKFIEKFIITHCHFPGATASINLTSMIFINNNDH